MTRDTTQALIMQPRTNTGGVLTSWYNSRIDVWGLNCVLDR